MRKPTVQSWFGRPPKIDGILSPGEWTDAEEILGVKNWTPEFSPVTSNSDLALRGWVKHDGAWLYFAFEIQDDVLYGIDTERWLPKENAKAHELSRDGYPWFGDEMELLLNASNTWQGDEDVRGDGMSWQMVCNLTKSRLDGVGKGGVLEGEPRTSESAWNNYQRWILRGDQRAAAKAEPGAIVMSSNGRSGSTPAWRLRPASFTHRRWERGHRAEYCGGGFGLGGRWQRQFREFPPRAMVGRRAAHPHA